MSVATDSPASGAKAADVDQRRHRGIGAGLGDHGAAVGVPHQDRGAIELGQRPADDAHVVGQGSGRVLHDAHGEPARAEQMVDALPPGCVHEAAMHQYDVPDLSRFLEHVLFLSFRFQRLPVLGEDVVSLLHDRVARRIHTWRRSPAAACRSWSAGLNLSDRGVILERGPSPPAAVREPLAVLHHEVDVMLRARHRRGGERLQLLRGPVDLGHLGRRRGTACRWRECRPGRR